MPILREAGNAGRYSVREVSRSIEDPGLWFSGTSVVFFAASANGGGAIGNRSSR
ncbi:MAG TPA: hypothetical protein VJH69_03725 [Candidatus Paceibacterota bacterium]